MKKKKDLITKLNLNILNYTNKTIGDGYYDFPTLYCNLKEPPDYIALYSQPCDYHRTNKTVLSFYDYDDKFDGYDGLYNAIYYNRVERLDYFKKRFFGIKYFILPDYSICGDIQAYRNIHRIGRSREVGIWLAMNFDADIIPNIGVCDSKTLDVYLDGIKQVNAIAISTKGRTNKKNVELIKQSINKACHSLINLKYIIVYDVGINESRINDMFEEAKKMGIKIVIPDNLLKTRNLILSKNKNGK